MSSLGDYFSISGDGILSVWGRDSESLGSYSNLILYTKEESKNILAASIKQLPLGNIIE